MVLTKSSQEQDLRGELAQAQDRTPSAEKQPLLAAETGVEDNTQKACPPSPAPMGGNIR